MSQSASFDCLASLWMLLNEAATSEYKSSFNGQLTSLLNYERDAAMHYCWLLNLQHLMPVKETHGKQSRPSGVASELLLHDVIRSALQSFLVRMLPWIKV